MGRRYQELEERDRHDVEKAKAVLKRLGDPERALIMRWLLTYFEDNGTMKSPQAGKPRRWIVLDGVEFWLVTRRRRGLYAVTLSSRRRRRIEGRYRA